MQRIFIGLAIAAMLLLFANVYLGLAAGDYNAPAHRYVAAMQESRRLQNEQATEMEIASAVSQADAAREEVREVQPIMIRHMLLGIGAALMTLLVCSVSITYFVGTSRWFSEVVDTYKLDSAYVSQSQRTKRRSFRWSLLGALAIFIVVGLGAAAEPTWANAQQSQQYVLPHYLASLITIGLVGLSFLMQGICLAENGRLIDQVMHEVRKIRLERGWAVEKFSELHNA